MTKLTIRALSILFALVTTCTVSARAEDVPSNTVRIGLYAIFYHVSADDITGPYAPGGLNLDVNNVQTLYLAYTRRLSPHFEAEFAFGWPPLTKTEGKGPASVGSVPYNGQLISTARWFAPTALLQYKFLDEDSAFRPYIGIGVNYTNFYDRDSTASGNAASGGPTKISLPSSIGPAATIGMSYRLAKKWSVYASYSITEVKSRLTADTAGVIRTTHINFGPQAFVLSAGYAF